MPGESEKPERKLGKVLERELQALEPWERPLFLQHIAEKYRLEPDEQLRAIMLQGIEEYREMSREPPPSRTPKLRLV